MVANGVNRFAEFPESSYVKGSIITRGDEQLTNGWYLMRGLVRQYVLSKSGDTLITHVFKPGACFPLTWILNEKANAYFYDALTPIVIKRVPREVVKEFYRQNPEELLKVTKRLLLGIAGLQERMQSLVLSSAYVKTAELLTYMTKAFGEEEAKGKHALPFSLPHREIAAWIGTTRETASLQIEELKRRGLIQTKGRKLLIVDLPQLTKIS